MAEEAEVPEHRCGFELTPKEAGIDWLDELTEWRQSVEAVTCCRETWDDSDRCIWHVKVEDKPIQELKSARTGNPERIDGAYLVGVEAGDELSFQGCGLIYTDFSGANFKRANFRQAELDRAQFHDTNLSRARFPDADLRVAKFHDANLIGAQFLNADLRVAEFDDADVRAAGFRNADLYGAGFVDAGLRDAQFPSAYLAEVQFFDADLTQAQFSNADLTQAELEGVDAQGANFEESNLQKADLTKTDLRESTLVNGHIDQTIFSDTRIDATTDFGTSADEWGPTCVYESHPEATEPPGDRSQLEAAEWVYRRLQKLHEENALSEEARGFHVRKEEARRQQQKQKLTEAREQLSEDLADNDLESAYESFVEMLRRDTRYSVSTLQWHLTRHGESIRQIFLSAGVLILACGLLYPFVGGFESSAEGAEYRIPLTEVYQVFSLDGVATLLQGIYFSIITFTTIGYGDLYPTGTGSKVLVGFESLAGAILIALFVFVLGRQVAR